MAFQEEAAGGSGRSAALDGWVAAFDREMVRSRDFATSVATMTADGCFDVHAVVERWILANPTGTKTVAQGAPPPQQSARLQLVPGEPPAPAERAAADADSALDEAGASPEPATAGEPVALRPAAGASPDVAYFHSLLRGGIERAQICEAFPEFRLVIDEAFGQYEAAAPVLSEVPAGPSREDLNDEIRAMRQKLQESGKRGRRRWRARG